MNGQQFDEQFVVLKPHEILAIMDGRQTQLRRVMRVQPEYEGQKLFQLVSTTGSQLDVGKWNWDHYRPKYFPCPFGDIGDRLWGKETYAGHWCVHDDLEPHLDLCGDNDGHPCNHKADLILSGGESIPQFEGFDSVTSQNNRLYLYYKTTANDSKKPDHIKWQSSMNMPRWASRINLKVKNIRSERLQDITYQDVVNQGVLKEWDGTAHWFKNYGEGAPGMFKVMAVMEPPYSDAV